MPLFPKIRVDADSFCCYNEMQMQVSLLLLQGLKLEADNFECLDKLICVLYLSSDYSSKFICLTRRSAVHWLSFIFQAACVLSSKRLHSRTTTFAVSF